MFIYLNYVQELPSIIKRCMYSNILYKDYNNNNAITIHFIAFNLLDGARGNNIFHASMDDSYENTILYQ